MKSLAVRWARSVSKDTKSLFWSYYLASFGVVLIVLHFTVAKLTDAFAYLAVLNFALGFNLFERYGFVVLLQEASDQSKPKKETAKETP